MSYFSPPKPRLSAHRGASGILPENTLPAFRAGLSAGATHLEMDVHATRDGHVVVIHDPLLDRTTDASGPVCELRLRELERVDAGYGFVDAEGRRPYAKLGIRVPTLEQVLTAFSGVPLNIEVKQAAPSIEDETISLLRRHHALDHVLLAAECQAVMDRIRASYPGPTGFTAEEAVEFHGRCAEDRWQAYVPPGDALQVPPQYEGVEVVTRRFVEAAHLREVEVHVWTLNDRDEVERLLALGVDGVMSDFPGMAAEVLRRA